MSNGILATVLPACAISVVCITTQFFTSQHRQVRKTTSMVIDAFKGIFGEYIESMGHELINFQSTGHAIDELDNSCLVMSTIQIYFVAYINNEAT